MHKLLPLLLIMISNLFGSNTEIRLISDPNTILKPYQLVNSNVEKYKKMSSVKDANGIPLLEFKGREIYYPITISQIALHYYSHYYETGNKNSKKEFLKYAKWMKENFQDNGTWGGWYTYDSLEGSAYHLEDKWMSAMSQGFGLSVMIEAFELTQDMKYLDLAEKTLNSFEIDVSNGGIKSSWGTTFWYDEYPTTPEKHVLNGFIFSLAGLYDYYTYTKSLKAKKLFFDGIKALHEHLASYDAGFNSFYSWSANPKIHGIASITGGQYHHLHIAQLLWLYKVTNDTFFYNWAHKFLQYDFGEIEQYGVSHKFKNIKATNTINNKTHGVDNLHDSIWSYGAYWSTHKFPTEIEIEFSKNVNNLNEFVLVTSGANIPKEDFDLYVLKDNLYEKVEVKQVDKQVYTERHFNANVLKYRLSKNVSNTHKIQLVFKRHDKKVLVLRELNFYYDMYDELNDMIRKLNYAK